MANSHSLPWQADPSPPHPAQAEIDAIRAAQRDPARFATLYETYVDLVWRYACGRLGDPDRANDATSITFTRALAALPGFRPRIRDGTTTFRSWLMTIARNVVIDEANRALRTRSGDLDATASHDQTAGIAERARIESALNQLSNTQRAIVEFRLAGFTSREIADALGMSLSAVKTAHFRAYAKLRDLLTDDPRLPPMDP